MGLFGKRKSRAMTRQRSPHAKLEAKLSTRTKGRAPHQGRPARGIKALRRS